jgi:hypothetical protein
MGPPLQHAADTVRFLLLLLLLLVSHAADAVRLLLLLLPGERIMKIAEELYQGGWISYPRTETDAYDPGMDLRVSGTGELAAGKQFNVTPCKGSVYTL